MGESVTYKLLALTNKYIRHEHVESIFNNLTTRPGLVTYACWPGYICDIPFSYKKTRNSNVNSEAILSD